MNAELIIPKIIPLFLVILVSCIKPLEQEPDDFTDYLVVEGFINDEFGPHDLIITRVSRFAGVLEGGVILPIDAEVTITDQFGTVTPVERISEQRKENVNASTVGGCEPQTRFIRVKTFHKTPPTFRGEVGNTYTLEIRVDGNVYRSEPVTMLPTPPIGSIDIRFKELPSLDPLVVPSGIEVVANWNDPVGERNFYQWIVNGIYSINSPDKGGSTCCLYDTRDGGAEECWILEKDIEGNELAFSDATLDGQPASIPVGFIQDDGLRFASQRLPDDRKYYIEVEQYQIPEDAFTFFTQIKTLSEIDGDIFDPFPQSIRGNLYNVEDTDEPVIGYFGAFSVQKADIFVPDSFFPFRQRFTEPCGDCRTRSGAQLETPEPFR